MRIYEGSPRQDWEEVLRTLGQFIDAERLKEVLFLEHGEGFLLQGLALPETGTSDHMGSLAKRTYQLDDERIAQLMDEAAARRQAADQQPRTDVINYYERALRIIGSYIDSQTPRDVFFFEQDGSFVVRLFAVAGSQGAGHSLAEFTREEMLAMIDQAPGQRR